VREGLRCKSPGFFFFPSTCEQMGSGCLGSRYGMGRFMFYVLCFIFTFFLLLPIPQSP